MNYKSNSHGAMQRTLSASHLKLTPLNKNLRQDRSGQWQQRYEHYRNLAQQVGDADRVTCEHYRQHAEHFYRLMNGSASEVTNSSVRAPAL